MPPSVLPLLLHPQRLPLHGDKFTEKYHQTLRFPSALQSFLAFWRLNVQVLHLTVWFVLYSVPCLATDTDVFSQNADKL